MDNQGMGRAIAGQLGACFLLLAASGCLSYQSRNSMRRAWVDFNSLGQPTIAFEQTDHLPYHAEQVGHFLWMYGNTPGHHNLYKDRRYQKDFLAGEAVPSEEIVTDLTETDPTGEGSPPANAGLSRIPTETIDPPRPKPMPLHPPAPPMDLSASPRKKTVRSADTPPPVPALPQPVGPSAQKSQQKSQRPTNRKSSPNIWTDYDGEKT